MEGDKLRNCKRAVRKIIKHLTPEDKFHLVVYGENAKVIFESKKSNIIIIYSARRRSHQQRGLSKHS